MGDDDGRYTDGYVVTLNTNYTVDVNGADGSSANGCWKVLGNHIGIKIDQSDCASLDDNSSDIRVVIKTTTQTGARAGFIADGNDFIGVGVEQKPLAIGDLNGTFDTLSYNFTNSSSEFMEVNVTNDGTYVSFVATPYSCNNGTCSQDTTNQVSGNIDINQICGANVTVYGVMCVTVNGGGSYMGFIDPKSGYFMMGNDDELIFGSKHH